MNRQTLNHFWLLFLCATPLGCAVSFTNSQQRISPDFRRVYLPAATDNTTSGGNSLRISRSVRRKLAQNTQFELVSIEDARWGIDIRIIERRVAITAVEVCTNANRTIAAGAVQCDDPEFLVRLPQKVADQEGINMTAEISTVDLRTGQTVRRSQVDLKGIDAPYWVVADKNGDGARIRTSLTSTREIHSLRYLENVDAAVERAGERIAAQVTSMMMSLSSENQNYTPSP